MHKGMGAGVFVLLAMLPVVGLPQLSNRVSAQTAAAKQIPRMPDGKPNLTKLRAPKFWSAQPEANIFTRHCAAHGYRASVGKNEFFAFEPQGHGTCHHEFWKNTEVDSVVTNTEMTAIDQRT